MMLPIYHLHAYIGVCVLLSDNNIGVCVFLAGDDIGVCMLLRRFTYSASCN